MTEKTPQEEGKGQSMAWHRPKAKEYHVRNVDAPDHHTMAGEPLRRGQRPSDAQIRMARERAEAKEVCCCCLTGVCWIGMYYCLVCQCQEGCQARQLQKEANDAQRATTAWANQQWDAGVTTLESALYATCCEECCEFKCGDDYCFLCGGCGMQDLQCTKSCELACFCCLCLSSCLWEMCYEKEGEFEADDDGDEYEVFSYRRKRN